MHQRAPRLCQRLPTMVEATTAHPAQHDFCRASPVGEHQREQESNGLGDRRHVNHDDADVLVQGFPTHISVLRQERG